MKVSVSLPGEDMAFLDAYAKSHGYSSRSAVVHIAIRRLPATELGAAYQDAWQEWTGQTNSALWDSTMADGLPS